MRVVVAGRTSIVVTPLAGGAVSLYERHKARKMLYFVRRHTTMPQWLCFLCVLPIRALVRAIKELARGNVRVVLTWLDALRKTD